MSYKLPKNYDTRPLAVNVVTKEECMAMTAPTQTDEPSAIGDHAKKLTIEHVDGTVCEFTEVVFILGLHILEVFSDHESISFPLVNIRSFTVKE